MLMGKLALEFDPIAVLALIISILSIYFSFKNNKYSAKLSLENEFIESTFKKYLFDSIPKTRKKIFFDKQTFRLNGFDDFTNVLDEMKSDLEYFQYRNINYYKKVKEKIYEIDDFIINASSKKVSSREETDFYCQLDCKIENLYSIILNGYLNIGFKISKRKK